MKLPKYYIFKVEDNRTSITMTDVTDEEEVVELYCEDCAFWTGGDGDKFGRCLSLEFETMSRDYCSFGNRREQ